MKEKSTKIKDQIKFTTYKNLNGHSPIIKYRINNDSIDIVFESNKNYYYKYNKKKPGEYHIEEMKKLAEIGKNLATYINNTVKKYAKEKGIKEYYSKSIIER